MTEHAISNARAWLAEIVAKAKEYDAAQNAKDWRRADELREEMQEMPLSVQVRDGWRSPGEESAGPDEYEILLSTGGPALRIWGKLDQYCQPTEYPDLQWQDWGTPWTDYPTGDDWEAVQTFASVFYFGEG